MKIMVFAEDPRLDQYMLKPIVEAALEHAGKPRAKVMVCQSANQRGDTTVTRAEQILELIEDNPLYEVYILCVDRDCREEREGAITALEQKVNHELTGKRFIAVCGREELEVWVLAGITDLTEPWNAIRSECHPKERYFDTYARTKRVSDTNGRGRKVLERAAREYGNRIRGMCPEVTRCEEAILATE
jgi:hypothetical protein